jgi:hypothetical protein
MSFGQRKIPAVPAALGPTAWVQLASLPIEVGVWMARLDLRGGRQAEEFEHAAIHAFLRRTAEKFALRPDLCAVIDEAQRLVDQGAGVLPAPLPERDLFLKIQSTLLDVAPVWPAATVNGYKLILIEMAEVTARAAAEIPAPWGLRRLRGRPFVSRIEKGGINRLIDCLGAGEMVKKWDLGDPARGPGVRVFTSVLRGGFFRAGVVT